MRRGSRNASAVLAVAGALLGCDSLSRQASYQEAQAVAETLLPAISFTALAADGHLYYSASVDTTAVSLQNLLQALALPVSVSRDGSGVVRIASSTPEGTKFTLVVQPSSATPANGAGVSQTRVTMEWESGADGAHGFQVLADLEVKHRRQTPPVPSKPQNG